MNQIMPYNSRNSSMVLRKPVEYLTLAEAETMKRACDIIYERSNHSKNDMWLRDRDKLLLQMMWTTGARISDVLSITDNYINFTDKTVRFLVKKRKDKDRADGQFWHTISIDMETLTEIMAYIHTWSIRGLLFRSHMNTNTQLTRQAVALKLNVLKEATGMTRNIHAHLWRHGLAMHLQGQGVPAELIAYRLAHSSTAITLSTYARLDALQERKMLESLGVHIR